MRKLLANGTQIRRDRLVISFFINGRCTELKRIYTRNLSIISAATTWTNSSSSIRLWLFLAIKGNSAKHQKIRHTVWNTLSSAMKTCHDISHWRFGWMRRTRTIQQGVSPISYTDVWLSHGPSVLYPACCSSIQLSARAKNPWQDTIAFSS